MRYLKKFENWTDNGDDITSLSDIKKQIISQLNDAIDDAFLPILDFGFKLEKRHTNYWDIVRVYTRSNPDTNMGPSPIGLEFRGTINNGEIRYDSKILPEYVNDINDVISELENALHVINGINGIDINFNLTNFYGEDKIIINIKL